MTDRELIELAAKAAGVRWSPAPPAAPVGYAVESDHHAGSVQIYPEAALRAAQEQKP